MRSWLRITVPATLSALLLALTGAISPASAAGASWTYTTDAIRANCLRVDVDGKTPIADICVNGDSNRWHWGAESNTWQGHSMKRLVNDDTGDCLTTDDKTDWNAVWMAPCGGGRSGQFWTADGGTIQNQNWNYLTYDFISVDLHSTPDLDMWCYWTGHVVS
ncbi:hypothetical protein [Streptomyces sp. NPDC004528]|uniref:hypothetical protein n=1 Tax=Streptomyces sp. NPDC004528 TaxID=3154550 RepID=UPI00339F0BA3